MLKDATLHLSTARDPSARAQTACLYVSCFRLVSPRRCVLTPALVDLKAGLECLVSMSARHSASSPSSEAAQVNGVIVSSNGLQDTSQASQFCFTVPLRLWKRPLAAVVFWLKAGDLGVPPPIKVLSSLAEASDCRLEDALDRFNPSDCQYHLHHLLWYCEPRGLKTATPPPSFPYDNVCTTSGQQPIQPMRSVFNSLKILWWPRLRQTGLALAASQPRGTGCIHGVRQQCLVWLAVSERRRVANSQLVIVFQPM